MSSYSRRGNALFIVLIAIGLFAALSYTVSNSFRGGTNTISDEQARIAAGNVIRALNDAKQGIDYLLTRGDCSLYNTPGKADHIRLNDPSNPVYLPDPDIGYKCFVYHPHGAGVSPPNHLEQYQVDYLPQPETFKGQLNTMHVMGYDPVVNGTQPAYSIILMGLNNSVCAAMNKMLQITVSDEIPRHNDPRLAKKTTGCFKYLQSPDINLAYMVYL